jgi:ferredoxin
MSYRINPEMTADIKAFGGTAINKCFNCGNCTAICSLSKEDTVFPRKIIRYLQLGMEDRLMESPEPWLCYYCGDCSVTCPREAAPGELMMAARRWLTSRYDWTGLSRKLYLSAAWEFGLLVGTALVVLALFLVPGYFGARFGFQAIQGEALEQVRLDLFAPKDWIHYGDWALAALLTLLLSINAFRMIFFLRRAEGGLSIPATIWLGEIPTLFRHALTQKRWLECDNDTRRRWLQHLLLVTGYGTMFMLVVFFLPWFQRDGADFHWTALFGYYATLVLLGVTVMAMRGRWTKSEPLYQYSHATDWMFLVLLFLTALSGILLHLCRLLDLPWPTYVLYVAHLMIAVPMLIIEVPFGKWLHLVFRPVAQYLVAVKKAAHERQAGRETKAQPSLA